MLLSPRPRTATTEAQTPARSAARTEAGGVTRRPVAAEALGPPPRPVVALVTDAIFPYHLGGKETRYDEIARRLVRHADVHVYTMKWWDGPRVRTRNGVTFHAISPLFPLYSDRRRSIRQALAFAIGSLGLLFARFDAIEADHMPYLHLFTLRLVAALRRKRLIVTWHEVWGPDYWREYLGPSGVIGWLFERCALLMPDGVIAASPETARRLRGRLPERTAVILGPHGVDLDAMARIEAAPDRTDIVSVGRLVSHKRLDLLFAAVQQLREQGLPVRCRVIGNGPDRELLHAEAQRLGIGDLVEFRHDVTDQSELYSLMKASRMFVFPSEREGFGAAALEALGCGLPVITTHAPDNLAEELVRRSTKSIVCAPDAVAIAEAIAMVLQRSDTDVGTVEPWLRTFDWDVLTSDIAGALLA